MKPNKLILPGILLATSTLFAQGQSLDSLATGMVPVDSVAILKAKKAQLEKELEQSALKSAKKGADSESTVIKVMKRKPRTGGAGGLTLGFVSQDMRPIKEMIVRRENEEKSFTSEDTGTVRINGLKFTSKISDREIMPTIGGTGYAGFDNGFRIGGSFRAAAQQFTATRGDSLYTMIVGTGWAGVLLEQAFYPTKKSAIIVGGNIGAGGVGTTIFGETGSGSGLSESGNSMHYDTTTNNTSTLSGGAGFFMGELHTGATVSVLPWLHLGGEFTTVFNHSSMGFNWSDGFTTVNPGGSARIIFGRAG